MAARSLGLAGKVEAIAAIGAHELQRAGQPGEVRVRGGSLGASREILFELSEQLHPAVEFRRGGRRRHIFQAVAQVGEHERLMPRAAVAGIADDVVLVQRFAGDDEIRQRRAGPGEFLRHRGAEPRIRDAARAGPVARVHVHARARGRPPPCSCCG